MVGGLDDMVGDAPDMDLAESGCTFRTLDGEQAADDFAELCACTARCTPSRPMSGARSTLAVLPDAAPAQAVLVKQPRIPVPLHEAGVHPARAPREHCLAR